MILTLTVAQRELINEHANRDSQHSHTRVLVCDDMEGVEKWFSNDDQSFEVSPETYNRAYHILNPNLIVAEDEQEGWCDYKCRTDPEFGFFRG